MLNILNIDLILILLLKLFSILFDSEFEWTIEIELDLLIGYVESQCTIQSMVDIHIINDIGEYLSIFSEEHLFTKYIDAYSEI